MRVITISREFGSGGRELGKRLAEELGFSYYDKEIVTEIANKTNLNENYVERVLSYDMHTFTYHFARSFSTTSMYNQSSIDILRAQQEIIKSLPLKGDCVIIGRSSDVILSEYNPFNIFVYASDEYKIKRCRQKGEVSENVSDKKLLKKIKQIDKNRKSLHNSRGETKWGEMQSYHLCINTTNYQIKELVPSIKALIEKHFEK